MKQALIIEDNENNMELIVFILEKHGYETVRTMSGREGIEKLAEITPDVVILDIQLPDIDGTDVLKVIRQMDSAVEVPVIAMTSYAMAGDREKLLEAGCDGYIEKPIDPIRVVQQIEKILGVTS